MADPRFERRLSNVENRVTSLETKFEMFIDEMRDFKTEMRQQNEMRAAEIREIRSSIDDMGKHVRNLTVAVMVGMGTMTLAGIAIVISIILK